MCLPVLGEMVLIVSTLVSDLLRFARSIVVRAVRLNC